MACDLNTKCSWHASKYLQTPPRSQPSSVLCSRGNWTMLCFCKKNKNKKNNNTAVAQWNTRFSRKWFYPFHDRKVTRHFSQMVVWSTQNAPRRQQFHVTVAHKPQALVYDILPSTTAVFSYAIGSRKLTRNVVLKLLCNILTVWACTLFWCRKFD